MKEFKTNKELIDFINSKGIKLADINKIERYSYYNIFNTYNFPFKDGNSYKNGVTFNEIYSLYLFDKHLRIIYLKYLLDIEEAIKASVSYVLMSRYGIIEYLNKKNFDTQIDEKIVDDFLIKINHEINKQIKKHDAFIHYKNKYGFIPPYVLMKGFSLGELSKLFGILKQSVRQEISKKFKLTDKVLKQILINFTIVRNICAHNDRLFTYSSKYKINIKNVNSNNLYPNLFIIKESMKLLLPYEDSIKLDKEINKEIKLLKDNIKSIDVNLILLKMGFIEKENPVIIELKEYLKNQIELTC